jgi:hypothetical protein
LASQSKVQELKELEELEAVELEEQVEAGDPTKTLRLLTHSPSAVSRPSCRS